MHALDHCRCLRAPLLHSVGVIDDSLAGYQRLRHISGNDRARLFLARREDHSSEQSAQQLWGLSCFSGDSQYPAALVEAECRERARGDHVVGIDDIAARDDGAPIIVHRWSYGGSLRRLMRERHSLRIGEAISIVAPLVVATRRAHDAGVVIGTISIDSVEFDERGAPIFVDFSAAQLVTAATPAESSVCPHILEDRRRLFSLCANVLAAAVSDRDGERRKRELEAWVSEDDSVRSAAWDYELEQKLFALGAPEPIQLSGDDSVGPPQISSLVIQSPISGAASNARGAARESLRLGTLDMQRGTSARSEASFSELEGSAALPGWITVQIREWQATIRRRAGEVTHRVRQWIAPVRRRTWIIAALGLVALCTAAGLSISQTTAALDGNAVQSAGEPTPSSAPRDDDFVEPANDRLALPEEPEEALEVLVTTRENCLRDLSVHCLDSVAAPESPAYQQDARLIAGLLAGTENTELPLFDVDRAVEVQRLGDSVLFDFESPLQSKPASLLLVKGEAGWRIRSYTLPEE